MRPPSQASLPGLHHYAYHLTHCRGANDFASVTGRIGFRMANERTRCKAHADQVKAVVRASQCSPKDRRIYALNEDSM
jgi:hypothetical protein